MTKTDLFKQFVESRQFVSNYKVDPYTVPSFVYYNQDGAILAHITIVPQTGLFNCRILSEELTDACLGKVEAFLWKHCAQYEYEYKVNVYHKGDNYGN
jgi:hypothetical protein